ncbi:flagellar assembly protein FliH [Pseudomonadota bacterium]
MSKIISAGEGVRAWAQPEIVSSNESVMPDAKDVKSEKDIQKELNALKQAAYNEGIEQGKQAGLAQAKELIDNYQAQFVAMLEALSAPVEHLDEKIEHELVDLSVAIARQIVRRELKTEPAQVVGVVKEALSILPSGVQNIKVYLNPSDAQLVSDIMLANVDERKWQVVEDPVMERGGCRVETDSSTVDAAIDARIAAIAVRLMGGERVEDE